MPYGFGEKIKAQFSAPLALLPRLGLQRQVYFLRLCLAAVTAIAFSALAYVCFPHLPFVKELTNSGGIYYDKSKIRDLSIIGISLLIQSLSFIFVFFLSARESEARSKIKFANPNLEYLFYFVLAGALLSAAGALGRLADAAVFLLFALGAATLHGSFRERWASAFATVFMLAALGAWTANNFGVQNVRVTLLVGYVALTALAVATHERTSALTIAYGIAGLGVAVAASLIAPTFWLPAGARVTPLDALVWALSLVAAVQVINWLRIRAAGTWRDAPLLPLAIALALVTTQRANVSFLPADDYHFSEPLLAVRALADGGLFSTFFTAHGLIDAAGILGPWLLGDASATGIVIGQTYAFYFATVLTGWLLFRFCGPLVGVLLLASLGILLGNFLAVLVVVAIVATASIRNDVLFGAVLAGAVAASVFLLNGTGVATALPSAFMAVFLFRDWTVPSLLRTLAGGAACGLALVLLLWRQIGGELFFLSTAADTNLFVYGNNFVPAPGFRVSRLLQMGATLLFALTPALGFALLARPKQVATWADAGRLALALAPLVAFVLLFTPYAMGRLDHNIYRGYLATSLILVAMAVWIAAPGLKRYFPHIDGRVVGLTQGILAFLLMLTAAPVPNALQRWSNLPLLVAQRAAASPADAALPTLGMAKLEPVGMSRLLAVKAVVEHVLKPGETFFDLTNRNALYFYLERPVPVPIASTYNAAPRAFQARDLDSFKDDPPPLVLAGVDSYEHDGYSLPLRAFQIYRYVLAHYTPFQVGAYTYGVRSDLVDRLKGLTLAGASADMETWSAAFHLTELNRLPSAWGRSLGKLLGQLRPDTVPLQSMATGTPEGAALSWTYAIPTMAPPERYGVLALDVACANGTQMPRVVVSWRGGQEAFSPQWSLTFEASFPLNLVPLDSSPRWLLAPSVAEIRITVEPPSNCGAISLGDVRLMGRT